MGRIDSVSAGLFVSSTLVFIWFLLNVSRANGGGTCHASAIASIFANTCKFRRSHPEKFYPQNINPLQKVRIGAAEVLDILTNGDDESVQVSSEVGHPFLRMQQERRKKETEDFKPFLTNELPESMEMFGSLHFGLVQELDVVQEAKWWKKLMRAGTGRGGKFRRNVGSTFMKCCSHVGCTESDFVHLC